MWLLPIVSYCSEVLCMELGELQGSESGRVWIPNCLADVLVFFPLLRIFYQFLIPCLGLQDKCCCALVLGSSRRISCDECVRLMNQIPKCIIWRSELRHVSSSDLGGACTPNPVLDTNPLFQTPVLSEGKEMGKLVLSWNQFTLARTTILDI